MFKVLGFGITVVLFAGFVVLTLPLSAYRWVDRHLPGQLSVP
jgi:hypothetical protein